MVKSSFSCGIFPLTQPQVAKQQQQQKIMCISLFEKEQILNLNLIPLQVKQVREVANLTERKNPHCHTNFTYTYLIVVFLVPKSCQEYSDLGVTESGTYMIDPDGNGVGYPAFNVFCDLQTG